MVCCFIILLLRICIQGAQKGSTISDENNKATAMGGDIQVCS
jgi:hypothetical protein